MNVPGCTLWLSGLGLIALYTFILLKSVPFMQNILSKAIAPPRATHSASCMEIGLRF